SRFVKHPVEVTGVLEIENLVWLLEMDRKWLEFDLRRQDVKMGMGRGSQLTLESVYGDGVNSRSTISVWVKFEKSMSTAYMTHGTHPDALLQTLEAFQHVWWCPDCRVYQIDLFSPDEDDLEEIPENYVDILRSRRWHKVMDPKVLTAFGFLINKYYHEEHLRDTSIELIMENTKVRSSAICSPRCAHLYFYPNLGFCEKVAGS
ncbi:hypothetical protein AN958_04023, partial [Leucoagaricus sp. SymC.cos]